MEHSTAALNASEEITPYRVHVSSKYLELTKKKLELTRLPHELLLPKAREWEFGTPKGVVEPLIDFWLEEYHWREREEHLNTTLPQFRTAISLPPALSTSIPPPPLEQAPTPPLRIHFIHLRSPHPSAIPLLLLPPFPLTNLSLSSSPLFTSLSKPESPTSMQAFHVVCPSIPGLGFSDAFTSSSSVLKQTADLFNTLMLRLGYVEYLCSSTASGRESPAGIDYRLPRMMGERFAENCVGVHVLEPVVEAPRVGRQTVAWMKFNVAKFFQANVWGYENEDWIALRASAAAARNPRTGESSERRALLRGGRGSGGYGATAHLGLREPNTLSYALTDSPVGILSMILSSLHKTSPEHKLSETQIIDITQLAWLPGPEAGLRFLSSATKDLENNEARETTRRSRIAVTVFTEESGYTPPAWLSTTHSIIFTQRVPGKAGLTIWERSDVLLSGIRGLARSLDALGLLPSPLERVVVTVAEVDEEEDEEEGEEGHGFQLEVESPDTDHTIVAAS